MKEVSRFLTRYFPCGENPFVSLNDFPFEKANAIKAGHCKRNNIGGFYAEDERKNSKLTCIILKLRFGTGKCCENFGMKGIKWTSSEKYTP